MALTRVKPSWPGIPGTETEAQGREQLHYIVQSKWEGAIKPQAKWWTRACWQGMVGPLWSWTIYLRP
jgi:hypothetical protein